ncbi:MAG TPA: glycosyltransferase [Gammaproteobacteria bacterium]|nr:glycosyltransferase [Gammaproteobacteria bacterium]
MTGEILVGIAAAAAAAWALLLLLPWQPHRTRERLESEGVTAGLADVAVLIPARNEARQIGRVLRALARQGPGLEVLVVDDESTDGTAALCRALAAELGTSSADAPPELATELGTSSADAASVFPLALRVLEGAPLPSGWAGKLWALEQGFGRVDRRYTLLLDADIELAPGFVPALRAQAARTGASLVSVMATLSCRHAWERLLVPAFIFFFKLLYPFALVASGRRAGAAGGCMLVETSALRAAGGFAALRGALIDDCTLARRLERRGARLYLGMSLSARSLREYARLDEFWVMVARTAFTQLRYSSVLLVATSAVMLVAFAAPFAALAAGLAGLAQVAAPAGSTAPALAAVGAAAVLFMSAAYLPVVRFYRLPWYWAATLPAAAALFLAMTWSSALNYWHGTRAKWKERSYEAMD